MLARPLDDIVSLDPGECYEAAGFAVVSNVYVRLLRYEPGTPARPAGGIAESWTVDADGRSYVFRLRSRLKFHSGAPVTAADAAFSVQRVVLLDRTPAFLFNQLGLTRENVRDLVTAPDPATLSLTLPEAFAPSLVLNLLSTSVGSVVEKNLALAHESGGDLGNAWLRSHAAASGGYRLAGWKANESVTLDAFAGFRLGAPYLRRVVLRHVAEPAGRLRLLEQGEADIALGLPPGETRAVAADRDIRVEGFRGAETWYLAMNLGFLPFADPRVRTALKHLIDYQDIVDRLLNGGGFVQQSFLPTGLPGAIPYAPFQLDVERARALLAEAGYPDGFEVRLTVPDLAPWTEIAAAVQETLAQGGVRAIIEPVALPALLENYRARRHELLLVWWGPDYFDPHTNAAAFAANDDNTDAAPDKTLAWRNNWLIPGLTRRTGAAAREPDDRRRAALYADLQRQVTVEGPFILMFQNIAQFARRATTTGFSPGITDDLTTYRSIRKS